MTSSKKEIHFTSNLQFQFKQIKRRIKTISTSEPSTSDEYSPVENKIAKFKRHVMSIASQMPTVVNGNTSLTTIHLNNQTKIAQNYSSPEKQKQQLPQSNHQSYQPQEQPPHQMLFQETTMQYQQQSSVAAEAHNQLNNTIARPPRTSEDFYLFCQFILEHENYNDMIHQEVRFIAKKLIN